MPPSPPRPPAPPTTGWMDRPGSPPAWDPPRVSVAEFLRQCLRELRKVTWPDGRAVRANVTLVSLTVTFLVLGLGVLELALRTLAGAVLA
jgi:preprotein translocase SecE subunit